MTPIDFLRTIWPDDGFYCIAIKTPRGWWHTVYPTIAQAAEFVGRQSGRDIYFCVHSLQQEQVWNPTKRNHETGEKGAWSIRTQANMREARVFFFDLDVGQGENKYPTIGAAVDALMRFCDETLLPQPMIVKSGGGVHVYWLLEDAIQSHQWRVYAARLRALAEAHGLIVDPARTTDVASVLRVAGTFNYKTGTPRPVEVKLDGETTPTEEFITLIGDACREAGVNADAAKPVATTVPSLNLPDHLKGIKGNIAEKPVHEFVSPQPGALFDVCPQSLWALSREGEVDYPVWRCWLSIFNCLEGGAQLCLEWSEASERFDEAAFEDAMANLGTGPYSCAQVADKCGAKRCEGCAYKDRGMTPIDAARMNETAEPPEVTIQIDDTEVSYTVPNPPHPYVRLKDGGVARKASGKGDDLVDEVLYEYDLFPLSVIINEENEQQQSRWRAVFSPEKQVEFIIDSDALYDKRKFTLTLPNKGVMVSLNNVGKLQAYMIAYVKKLQREAEAEAQHNHLGWTEDKQQFILPDKILCADGSVKPVNLSKGAERAAGKVDRAGSLEKQVELLDFYNHKLYMPNQFVILAGLAAPIFHMTGHHGAIINASGDAGSSKSMTLYTAASLWGIPDRYPLNGTNSGATVKARNNYMTTLANLPVCVDEITHLPPKDAADMAMNVTQAEGRIRLEQTGIQRAQPEGTKSTIMLTTANSSLHALLSLDNTAGTAGSMRVVEIAFRLAGVHSKHQADLYWAELTENYGHIGPAFMRYVIQNQAEIKVRVLETMRHLDALCGVMPSERFWSAVCAAVIVAGQIAYELGLLRYNMILIKNWIIDTLLPYMRGAVQSQYATPLGVLTEFLEQINEQILVTSPAPGEIGDNVIREVRGSLSARYDTGTKTMWVLKKAFKDYCVKIGANHLTVLNDLNQRRGDGSVIIPFTTTKKVLGYRTRLAKAQTPCFVINMNHPDVCGILEKPVEEPKQEPIKPEPVPEAEGKRKKGPKFDPFKR